MDERTTKEQLEELMEMDPLIRTAEERLAFLSGDEEMIRLYEAREEALLDRNSLIRDAREEGREEGREEAIRMLAMKLLRKGSLTVPEIAELIGLPEAEVKEIRERYKVE